MFVQRDVQFWQESSLGELRTTMSRYILFISHSQVLFVHGRPHQTCDDEIWVRRIFLLLGAILTFRFAVTLLSNGSLPARAILGRCALLLPTSEGRFTPAYNFNPSFHQFLPSPCF
ncbi:hypothetical protein K491DRAFT_315552 [Lophiostoma macrostomum CBS 122681]|uniref:Uncharacterized protein n=1 Tax=Lophiostoma macrostomum CBS 122681 TaxID=1314788 RepID=A0A6A6TE69_9PLEO|nr:hypothetical protein K491DRAFT_315552 [Lophiostoma macrostomum CBS 122681]